MISQAGNKIIKRKRLSEVMSKVAVVYWSGTGNTEEMANKVAEGAKAAGAEVEVISADDFDGTDISSFDGVASDALQWEMRSLRIPYSSRYSKHVSQSLQAKK